MPLSTSRPVQQTSSIQHPGDRVYLIVGGCTNYHQTMAGAAVCLYEGDRFAVEAAGDSIVIGLFTQANEGFLGQPL